MYVMGCRMIPACAAIRLTFKKLHIHLIRKLLDMVTLLDPKVAERFQCVLFLSPPTVL